MSAPTCRVIRDGVQDQIPASELVVGDIVYLDDGCIIPADIRLIDASSLRINESALTGESVPVEKNSDIVVSEKTVIAEQVNMAFASTIVTNGKSYGVVVNVGKNSEVGKIAELLNENDHEEIPLQKKLNAVCKKLTIVGAIVCLIVVVTSLLYDVNG
jgi:Ca2+-transporting ATPase